MLCWFGDGRIWRSQDHKQTCWNVWFHLPLDVVFNFGLFSIAVSISVLVRGPDHKMQIEKSNAIQNNISNWLFQIDC